MELCIAITMAKLVITLSSTILLHSISLFQSTATFLTKVISHKKPITYEVIRLLLRSVIKRHSNGALDKTSLKGAIYAHKAPPPSFFSKISCLHHTKQVCKSSLGEVKQRKSAEKTHEKRGNQQSAKTNTEWRKKKKTQLTENWNQ